MKKLIAVTTALMLLTSCTYNNSKNLQEETAGTLSYKINSAKTQQLDYEFAYEILNKPILDINSIDLLNGVTEDEVYYYSEEVKGEFVVALNDESLFPPGLVKMLEEALYNSCNYSPGKLLMMDIRDNPYFDTIRSLGYENFILSLDDLYHLFPELHDHKDEFKSEYDVYKFISGTQRCIDMFRINMTPGEDNYVLVYDLGGSNGAVSIELTKLVNNEFITISEFKAQNGGYGEVIKYQESFYYVFLQYNYNLKNYDSIRLHKLGLNAETENILIRYLPENYIWKNVYANQNDINSNLSVYIDSIKSTITSDEYLANGSVDEIGVINGEETEDTDFILADEYNPYQKIDFANLGIPIYIRKSNHIPSNYLSTWYLKARFYIYDSQTDSVMELNNLELGKYNSAGNELVQMWFKEIDNRIFTFRIYHISDYNYVLSVTLIEGDRVTQVRNDIFSPQRRFILTEGIPYIDF